MKRKSRPILVCVLALLLIALLIPCAMAEESHSEVTTSVTGEQVMTIEDAFALQTEHKELVITLKSDGVTYGNMAISSGSKITLDLNGYVLKQVPWESGGGYTYYLFFNVNSNGTFTLRDSRPDQPHQGYVTSDGLWHYGTSAGGEQVVTLNGGILTGNNNWNAGTRVQSGGTFIMESGTLAGNKHQTSKYSPTDGGGGVKNEGTFIMKGGMICYNTCVNVYAESGAAGVYIGEGATFTMTGGTICNNRAPDNVPGGVCNLGKFIMTGGEISNNSTRGTAGGVYTFGVTGNTITVGGTARIINNTNEWEGTSNVRFIWVKPLKLIISKDTPPAEGMMVGVYTDVSGDSANFTDANAADYSKYFVSDNSNYVVADGADHVLQLRKKSSVSLQSLKKDIQNTASNLTAYSREDLVNLLDAYEMLCQNEEIRAQMQADEEFMRLIATLEARLAEISTPKTGDTSHVPAWIALALLSGIALVGMFVWRKKRG